MSSLALSVLVFVCALVSAFAAMSLRRFLPESHVNTESRDSVKLGVGLIGTLASLVLGLLIATAKGTYDAQSGVINELSASYIMLDRVLGRYGPEATEARDLVKKSVASTLDRIWPDDDSRQVDLIPGGDAKTAGDVLFDKVANLVPKNEAQRELRTRALNIMASIGQARLHLYARQHDALPMPFLVVLTFWLMFLFAGYGLLAPGNGTVVVVIVVCTLSVSGAVFLMLELAAPFTGIMRIPSTPLQHAFSSLGQ